VDVVRRLISDVWNGGRLELLDELFADPFDHDGRPGTADDLRRWHAEDSRVWADARYEIVDWVAADGRVAVFWRATARQVGAWGPVPATGREVRWPGMHMFRISGGRIVGMSAVADRLTKALALGATVGTASVGDRELGGADEREPGS
jgi:predicted ester cyclase